MLALHEAAGSGLPGQPDAAPSDQQETAMEGAILCAACAGTITSSRHRIEVNGAHEHRFMNPGGYLFHIGCFAEAVGCTTIGPASNEYPWFPGFTWRIADCGHCHLQLGWRFESLPSAGFFGLVLSRLRQAASHG